MTNTDQYTLSPQLLLTAYSQGYFPMPDPSTSEILWFRPNPRAIIPLNKFHVSRSLKKKIKKNFFTITFDNAFKEVMEGCAENRETWITQEFKDVYYQMHTFKMAHSVEVWFEDKLVGGTYGVCLGGAFFAESKFHRMTDASKIALYYLVERMKERGLKLLECQFLTPHLSSLGAEEVSDSDYIILLKKSLQIKTKFA